MKVEDIIDRIVAGESVTEVVDELTTSVMIPAKPPKPLGLVLSKRKYKGKDSGRLPYTDWREPPSSPAPTYHRSYEDANEAGHTKPASYTGGYAGVSGALATRKKTAKPFSRHDPEFNPWLAALRGKRYRGMNVGFGKSRAMSEQYVWRYATEETGTHSR